MNNQYQEGEKIKWLSILNGKITQLIGRVSSIQGETICAIGQDIFGNWWRDYVSIYDRSIAKIENDETH